MCMEHTTNMRFGPLVTNPDVRDWSVAASIFGSLSKQSGGRFDLAVGRGDSSVRVMGKKPATLARVAEFIAKTQAMVRGEEVTYGEIPAAVKFPWAVGHEMPSWIAAYGPLALKTAGEHADGVVLQLADPGLCKWFTDQCIEAGQAAGGDTRCMRAASMLIVKKGCGPWLNNDQVLNLRVDDNPEPIKELRRLVEASPVGRGNRRGCGADGGS